MKARNIGYWVATGLIAVVFGAGGALDAARTSDALEVMAHLGYPVYFLSIIGPWKMLAAVAVLVPRFPRLKEWAYAGIVFDLTGAAASHAASGDGAGQVIPPLVLVAIAAVSWALRPEGRILGQLKATPPPEQPPARAG
jgi:hypothetical protein